MMAVPVLRWAGRLAPLTLVTLMLAFPAGVAAVTNEPIAQTGGMTATLPLLGTSLTVDVSLDAAGNISGVSLDPAGALEKKKTTATTVKFANTDGTTKVTVRARGSKLSISARATLADLVGAGVWSADVFGTGAKSTVRYTIGNQDGKPTLAIGTVTTPPGVTATVTTSRIKVTQAGAIGLGRNGKGGNNAAIAVGGVTFAHGGFVKRLVITVSAGKDGTARLRITLSGRDRQKLIGTLAELAGPRTWTGHLADGTKVAVGFHVNADGAVSFDGATGAPATSRSIRHGLRVTFGGTRLGVTISLLKKGSGDTYVLVVNGFARQATRHFEKHQGAGSAARHGAVLASSRGAARSTGHTGGSQGGIGGGHGGGK